MEARLEQSRNALEPIIQSYDLARLRLNDSETRLSLATAEMNDARHNLVAARATSRTRCVRSTSSRSPTRTAVLLGAGSISQALDEMAFYNRTRGLLRPHGEGDRHLEDADHDAAPHRAGADDAPSPRVRPAAAVEGRHRPHDRAQPAPAARAQALDPPRARRRSDAGSGSPTRSPRRARARRSRATACTSRSRRSTG